MGCSVDKPAIRETKPPTILTDPDSHINSLVEKQFSEEFQARKIAIQQKYKNKQKIKFAQFLQANQQQQQQSGEEFKKKFIKDYTRIQNDFDKECQQAIQECEQHLRKQYEDNKKIIKEVLFNLVNTQYKIQNGEVVKDNLVKSKQSTLSSGKEEIVAQPLLPYPNLELKFQQLPAIEIVDEELKKILSENNNTQQ